MANSSAQVTPAFSDTSIRYPVMGAPPLKAGASHMRLICEWSAADAKSCSGRSGTVASVVAPSTPEGGPVPTRLIADTR